MDAGAWNAAQIQEAEEVIRRAALAVLIWLAAFIMLLLSGTACATVRKSMPSPVPAIKQLPGGCVLQGGLHRPCPPTA